MEDSAGAGRMRERSVERRVEGLLEGSLTSAVVRAGRGGRWTTEENALAGVMKGCTSMGSISIRFRHKILMQPHTLELQFTHNL